MRQKQTADSKLVFPFYILESGDWTFSAFRIFSRGIVPPYRTTTGPTSKFNYASNLKAAGRSYKPGGLLLKRSVPQSRRPLLFYFPVCPNPPVLREVSSS